MSSTTQSYLFHLAAGAVIVAVTIALAGIPQSWQSMTVGGILAIALKAAHDVAGY